MHGLQLLVTLQFTVLFSDVLGALIKLECFDILETIRPKAERYIEHYKMGSKFDPSATPANDKLVTFLYTTRGIPGRCPGSFYVKPLHLPPAFF